MSESKRILMVEDLPSDAELVRREVEQVLPGSDLRRVETRAAFLAALDGFNPDLILCDFKLPQFDGLSALELTLEHRPETPFIIVTGSMDEDTAVACMKKGAWDYVIKEHLQRIGPAVLNALVQQQERQAQKLAREKSRRWERVFSQAQFGLAHVNVLDNSYIEVNATFARERGYAPAELAGLSFMQTHAPEERAALAQHLSDIDRSGHGVFESVHVRQDGSRFAVLLEVTTINDDSGQPLSRVVYALDVSESKAAAQEREQAALRWRLLIEQSRDGIVVLDQNGHVYEANKRFGEMLGYAPEELATLHVWDWDNNYSRAQLLEMLRDVDASGDHFETRHRRKDGTFLDVELSTNGAIFGDQKLVFCLVRDITERKRLDEALRKSETLFRNLFEDHSAVKLLIDPENGAIINANQAAAVFYGWTREQLKQMRIQQINTLPPEQINQEMENTRIRQKIQFNFRHRRADGSVRDVEVFSSKIDSEGKVLLHSIVHDITDRKRAEEALRDSEANLKKSQATAKLGSWIFTPPGKIAWTAEMYRIFGLSAQDFALSAKSFFNLIHPDDRAAVRVWIAAGLAGEKLAELVFRSLLPDGSLHYFSGRGERVDSAEGLPANLAGTVQDITERIQSELALRKSQDLLNETQHLMKMGGWEYDVPSGRITWTDEVYRIHGLNQDYDPNSPQRNMQFYTAEDRPKIAEAFRRALEEGVSYDLELHLLTAQAEPLWVRTSGRVERRGDQIVRVFGNIMDISERKAGAAERELLTAAIKQVGEIIVITDPEGTIQYVNPAFETVTGYSCQEALGQNPRLLKSGRHDMAFYQALWTTITAGRTWSGRLVNRCKDGSEYTEAATISPVRDSDGRIVNFVGVKRDISAYLQLDAQFQQAQRMESVGRLAGGVAHDFNNILSVIIGYAELSVDKVPAADPLRAYLQEILKAGWRSRDITRQLLAFARQQTIAPEVLDLNSTVESMLKMLRRLIGEDIDLAWLPGSGLWRTKMDPSQIDQILANLCVNARDAIAGVGKITIATDNLILDEAYRKDHRGFVPGEFVLLAVSDDGSGMNQVVIEKIFEPFFTTKGVGKGTGLGLATVYGIVKQNDGFVNVSSRPGEGTTFDIFLPRYKGEIAEVLKEMDVTLFKGQGETILVVEDDATILEVTRRILEYLNYAALCATTPHEALRMVAQHEGELALLITDVVMPEMNGPELAKQLRTLRPNIKYLYMSGYTADVIAHRGILDQGVNFIHKPFSAADMANAIRKVMGNQFK